MNAGALPSDPCCTYVGLNKRITLPSFYSGLQLNRAYTLCTPFLTIEYPHPHPLKKNFQRICNNLRIWSGDSWGGGNCPHWPPWRRQCTFPTKCMHEKNVPPKKTLKNVKNVTKIKKTFVNVEKTLP